MTVEWDHLRWALVVIGGVFSAWVIGWGVHAAVTEEPTAYDRLERCLRNEKRAALEQPRDPIARSAELGTLRTVIETNGVTVSVAASVEGAHRIIAAYRSVAGELGKRLELRGRTVYLWDRAPSSSQRQTLFDCTY